MFNRHNSTPLDNVSKIVEGSNKQKSQQKHTSFCKHWNH